MAGQEVLYRRVGERSGRQAHQMRQAAFGGLNGSHEGNLVLRAPASLAAAALASELGKC